jgi:hypothetical protein
MQAYDITWITEIPAVKKKKMPVQMLTIAIQQIIQRRNRKVLQMRNCKNESLEFLRPDCSFLPAKHNSTRLA